MKILFVQDHATATGLRRSLEDRGHKVAMCVGALHGQQQWASERRPLVVLDFLNAADGEAFCRWLGAQPGRNRTFVVATLPTDRSGGGNASKLLDAGADDLFLSANDPTALRIRLEVIEHQARQHLQWVQQLDDLNTRSHQQVAIAALGQCALSHDLSILMDLTCEFIMRVLDVDFCGAFEFSGNDQPLKFASGFGWRPGQLLPFPPAESLTGRTLPGEPFMVTNMAQDDRFTAPDFLKEQGIISAISVAIKGEGKGVFGVLGAYASEERDFREDDLRFVEGLANVLGAAMDRKCKEAEIQKHQDQVQHLQRLESVGQLAAGLAHDYNNVLTIIHGHVTLALADSSLAPRIAGSLKTVLEAVERAAELTRHLLSFSRKQSMELKPVDVNGVITSVAKLLDRVLGSHIRLELRPSAALPLVEADPGMLDQVLLNLAVNARDAMPAGGNLVIATSVALIDAASVHSHPHARQGEFVCLTVSDTGCGIDPATLRHIFDPFFTTKEAGKGTGLGLSTVYGIVQQHQGWVEVDSRPGKGAAFRIYLPSHGRPAERVAAAIQPALVQQGAVILLVDDELTLRQLARLLLENMGYEVVEAGSGSEAIQLWGEHKDRIQILLTDFMMPDGLTGLELANQLRSDRPQLKVILTSGYSADSLSNEGPGFRGARFLKKPYGADALQRVVWDCLNESGHSAQQTLTQSLSQSLSG